MMTFASMKAGVKNLGADHGRKIGVRIITSIALIHCLLEMIKEYPNLIL